MKIKPTFLLIIAGLLIGLGAISVSKIKIDYSMVNTSPPNGIEKLKKMPNNSDVTIILQRTGCKYCEQDEQTIVSSVLLNKFKGKKILVFDLKQMNTKQTDYLKKHFNKVLYQNKLVTPTVFTAVKSKGHWYVNNFENTGDLVKIKKIINS